MPAPCPYCESKIRFGGKHCGDCGRPYDRKLAERWQKARAWKSLWKLIGPQLLLIIPIWLSHGFIPVHFNQVGDTSIERAHVAVIWMIVISTGLFSIESLKSYRLYQRLKREEPLRYSNEERI